MTTINRSGSSSDNGDEQRFMVDIITKKRDGGRLSNRDIEYFVQGVVDGVIPDYQTAALLMAIYWRGLGDDEVVSLTRSMAGSGVQLDLSDLPGIKVDKHSTGGVADTTSIILAPLAGAAGVRMAKMSGRGLGHTGGTIDKLESIPGFRVNFSVQEMIGLVQETGVAIVEQTDDLVPADRLLYALRDVTGTAPNIGLIASSVMSKKLAAGSDRILLDVKTGRGAFMPRWSDAVELAEVMVGIGESFGVQTVALLTNMEQPLGRRIGNSLEILEAMEVLSGQKKGELLELCLYLGAELLVLAGLAQSRCEGAEKLEKCIASGAALDKFRQMVISQGGDGRIIEKPELLPLADRSYPFGSTGEGYIWSVETREMGQALANFGVGRATQDKKVDPSLGVSLHKRLGDYVRKGDLLFEVAAHSEKDAEIIGAQLQKMYTFKPTAPEVSPIILGRVDSTGYHELTD